MNIMDQFHNTNKILFVGWSHSGAHPEEDMDKLEKWTEIDGLKAKQIGKIRVGKNQSIFIDYKELYGVAETMQRTT